MAQSLSFSFSFSFSSLFFGYRIAINSFFAISFSASAKEWVNHFSFHCGGHLCGGVQNQRGKLIAPQERHMRATRTALSLTIIFLLLCLASPLAACETPIWRAGCAGNGLTEGHSRWWEIGMGGDALSFSVGGNGLATLWHVGAAMERPLMCEHSQSSFHISSHQLEIVRVGE